MADPTAIFSEGTHITATIGALGTAAGAIWHVRGFIARLEKVESDQKMIRREQEAHAMEDKTMFTEIRGFMSAISRDLNRLIGRAQGTTDIKLP